MTNVFDRMTGQDTLAAELRDAATSARAVAARLEEAADGAVSMFADDPVDELPVGVRESMTHAWLFTGPPGSGRSVAATAFAAALQCLDPIAVGCGECRACTTVLSGTHGDVRLIQTDGLSISVKQIRDIVSLAARRPTTGRWQIVLVEDADRLTENGANALLKAVEEPPPRTIFLLCAPSVAPEDIAITLRSRCRHVALTAPPSDDIAKVLIERDGIDPEPARWAASVSGGHVGRAKRLATDPLSREQREQALGLARAATRDSTAFAAADRLVRTAVETADAMSTESDAAETEELMTALGAGGTGKGTARPPRGTAGIIKELERRQKSRRTRLTRDVLDRALVDLAALFRDALSRSVGARVTLMHPDKEHDVIDSMASYASPEKLLACIEAVLDCREALDMNVKPKFAVGAMVVKLGDQLSARR
ncbi:DNA polymerase III subunit delta' [Gordonia sp. HY002]|uniref:DNA polymerase III subunit delta' n=1 Tax=Gordonia zhenghanii TaxID=2911516 RepID=UPI001EF13B05|nr:DNA polymerase III subunit delta' [Gordonia zhenghanii]MCF8569137.1 DNA polymerase III subunit delta' [Gordonia zhenghanii]MCF8603456.1 DNA polymerase III subunit delta' [Gordonia zhenghanii]